MSFWRRVIIHADMDAFYASVEQLDFPEYRGKPVIVGADPQEGRGRGVVCASSYEAREFGIHSAMPITQAYRRCPHGIFRPVRGRRYAEISRRIMVIFREYTPLVEAISLDEAFLDMTGTERLIGDPVDVGREIKDRILREEELTVSIGIGPNKLIAKIASDFDKPDGFTVVKPKQVNSFLAPMPVKRLWGIGKKTADRLNQLGIQTIGQFAKLKKEDAQSILGNHGIDLWYSANGVDHRPVSSGQEVKSISNERTFNEDVYDEEVHKKTILFLSEKVGYRLRKKNLWGRTVSVKVRLSDFKTYIRNFTLPEPVNLSETIYQEALKLYQKVNRMDQPVRLLGVGVSQLMDENATQQSLLFDENEKKKSVTDALDQLKQKYGENAIGKGSYLCDKLR